MTFWEIAEKGTLNTILGMGTVFVVLILISLLIGLFKYIPMLEEKIKKKNEIKTISPIAMDNAISHIIQNEEEVVDDLELVAVIMAALKCVIEEEKNITIPNNGLVVKSIKKVNKSKWQNA